MTVMQGEMESSATMSWLRVVLIGRSPKRTLARLAVLVVACFVIFKFILLPIRVTGGSMLPTYKDHGVNFVNRLAYLWHEPRRGDVVAIRMSDTSGLSIMYMKRVVGLPGETVAFADGHVLINGRILNEPYLKYPCDWDRDPVTLNSSQFFVVGDNRSMPQRDHTFGRADRRQIVGKVLL